MPFLHIFGGTICKLCGNMPDIGKCLITFVVFPSIVKNVSEDPDFYALLSIVDSIRIGKSRERNTAIELLDKYLQDYGSEK